MFYIGHERPHWLDNHVPTLGSRMAEVEHNSLKDLEDITLTVLDRFPIMAAISHDLESPSMSRYSGSHIRPVLCSYGRVAFETYKSLVPMNYWGFGGTFYCDEKFETPSTCWQPFRITSTFGRFTFQLQGMRHLTQLRLNSPLSLRFNLPAIPQYVSPSPRATKSKDIALRYAKLAEESCLIYIGIGHWAWHFFIRQETATSNCTKYQTRELPLEEIWRIELLAYDEGGNPDGLMDPDPDYLGGKDIFCRSRRSQLRTLFES
ncbi:hypothetical protein B0J14DRAFT_668109 [Halenospora varia]|nr:hypothetical protein B0J14DRAFT_668109 [Halenospora varia]